MLHDMVLWSGVTLETSSAIKAVLEKNTNLRGEEEIDSVVRLIMDSMLIHNSNEDKVYYYTAQSYKSRVQYYTHLALPFIRNLSLEQNVYWGERYFHISLPKSDDKTIKTFSGDNDGMTEISPINATIGAITTPATKSKFQSSNSQDETYIKFENGKSRIKMLSEDYTNAIKYFHSIFVNLIVEYHTVY